MIPAALVYVLCFLAALACAALLFRAFHHSGSRLLLWTGLGFAALTVNNLLLVLDLVVWRDVDLWGARQGASLLAIGIFVYGFLWEVER